MPTIPSYKTGFARCADESEAPDLRRGCVFAINAALGNTGTNIPEISGYRKIGTSSGVVWDMMLGGRPTWNFGVTNYIGINKNIPNSGEVTIAAIISNNSLVPTSPILSSFELSTAFYDYIFEINRTSSKLSFIWGGNTSILTSATTLATFRFYHVVARRSGVTGAWKADIFVNGVLDATTTTATNPNGSANARLDVGSYAGSGGSFPGYIAEVTMWNYPLPDALIRKHYVDSLAMWRLMEDEFGAGAASTTTVPIVNGGLFNRGLIGSRGRLVA